MKFETFNWIVVIITLSMLVIPVLNMYHLFKRGVVEEGLQEEILNNITKFCNNMFLYLICAVVYGPSIMFYYMVAASEKLNTSLANFIGTGIVLPFYLWLIGVVIRKIYGKGLKQFNLEDKMEEEDREVIFTISLLGIGCLLLTVEGMSQFIIFITGIVIGRYIWIDTTKEKLLKVFTDMLTRNKLSLYIGIVATVCMLILIFAPKFINIYTVLSIWLGIIIGLGILFIQATYDYIKQRKKDCKG